MSQPTLSAILIVRDEERHLKNCLESLAGVVDEIVVVDTGSTDRTLEIASEFGAVIGSFNWCDDFAAARNASLNLATGDWALWIDADETLDAAAGALIRNALDTPGHAGFVLEIVNYTRDDSMAESYCHRAVRLFRRLPGVEFCHPIHEQITPALRQLGLTWTGLEGARIHHYGYTPAEMARDAKIERTLTILEHAIEREPYEPFHWFNLANAHWVNRDAEPALEAAWTCLRLMPGDAEYGPILFQILSSATLAQGDSGAALAICDSAEAAGFGGMINDYERGCALLAANRYQEALAITRRLIQGQWREGTLGDVAIATWKRHYLHSQALAAVGDGPGAISALDPIRAAELLRPCLRALAEACAMRTDWPTASTCFERAWRMQPEDVDSWLGWVNAAQGGRRPDDVLHAFEAYAEHQVPTGEMLVDWGRALAEAGRSDQAVDCFAEAMRRDPSDANAGFNLGDLLYRQGAYLDAAQMYEHALRLQPGHADGWFTLGNCFAQLGILEGANTAYRQALSLNPEHVGARHNLDVVSGTAA